MPAMDRLPMWIPVQLIKKKRDGRKNLDTLRLSRIPKKKNVNGKGVAMRIYVTRVVTEKEV
jgi:hypothetical protein